MPIVEKVFCRSFASSNTQLIYGQTPMLEFLNKHQIGFCSDNSFILGVKKIIKQTPMLVNIERCGGICNFNVMFLADVLVYDVGEIIPVAKVIKIDEKNEFALEAPNTSIHIMKTNTPLDQHINVGSEVPVRVEHIAYNYLSKTVSVIASFLRPWTPPPSPPVKSSEINLTLPAIVGLMNEIKKLQTETDSFTTMKQTLSGKKTVKNGMHITDQKLPTYINQQVDSMWDLLVVESKDVKDTELTLGGKEQKEKKVDSLSAAQPATEGARSVDAIVVGWLNNVKKNLVALRDIAKKYKHDASEKAIWAYYLSGF